MQKMKRNMVFWLKIIVFFMCFCILVINIANCLYFSLYLKDEPFGILSILICVSVCLLFLVITILLFKAKWYKGGQE